MFSRCIFILVIIGTLTACASQQNVAAARVEKTSNVTFFDSSIFDTDLNSKLENTPNELVIDFPSRFDLNSLPPRIEKWLAAIKEQGGDIKLVRTPSRSLTRGFLMDAVDLVIRAYDKLTEQEAVYESAKGYNTKIFYDDDGKVSKIILAKS